MVSFHILDCEAQDIEVTKETEYEKEVKYILEYENEFVETKVTNKREYIIHLFGTTSEGKSIRVSVSGFEPYFYIELPDNLKHTYTNFIEILKHETKHIYFNHTYVKQMKLYGYTNNTKFPFVKLSVKSRGDFYKLKKLFLDQKNNPIFKYNNKIIKVYEANLDPLLRFFHLKDISPCGWASVDQDYEETLDIDFQEINPCINPSVSVAPFTFGFWDIECFSASGDFPLAKKNYSKVSEQLYETSTNYNEFKQYFIEAIINPYNPPKNINGIFLKKDSIPEITQIESDLAKLEPYISKAIESQNYGEFEKVMNRLSKQYPISGDPIIQIGVVFSKGTVLDESHIFVLNSCDPIENIHVYSCKSEKDLILKFLKLLNDKNPDILLGYNVFGFDQKYLYERMKELNISETSSLLSLNRLNDVLEYNPSKPFVYLQEKFLSSSALGDNNLYILTTTGRLHIDLYFYIKRIENLGSYKLDDVCSHYMSGKLESIDIRDQKKWFIKTKNTSDAEVGKYIVLLDEIGDTIVEKRKIVGVDSKKGIYIETKESDIDFTPPMLEAIEKWCIVKDDISPSEIFSLHLKGGSSGRATIAKYCIQDCVLVYQLFQKLDVFNNAMAMANTCSVPISYIFTRGQGIKCESLIFKECALRSQLIEVLSSPIQQGEEDYIEESYEGAIVLVPEPNFYVDSPIGVADFASLYPSTIISENISYDTLLWTKDYDMNYKFVCYSFGSIDDEKYLTDDVKFTDIEFDIWAPDPNDTRKDPEKIKTGIRVCRYVQQSNDMKGTLPDILTKLLAARKAKRKQAEKESDPFKKALLDAEQLAYKLTANSLYGQLGSRTFKIRLQDLAASTTAYGRKQIMFAKDAIEMFYGPGANDPRCCADGAKIVYGDSVASYTPVIIRRNGSNTEIDIVSIESLANDYSWTIDGKEYATVNNVESWTEQGWTPITTIMRHKLAPNKKMIRVFTENSMVDVTDDHSLITSNGISISPKDLKIDDTLLHSDYPNKSFDITTVKEYNLLLHKTTELKQLFYSSIDNTTNCISDNQVLLAKLIWNANILGINTLLEPYMFNNIDLAYPHLKFDINTSYINLVITKNSNTINNAIKKLYEIPYEGYVYDLTTANHHFQAGIGKMIVHNTDSLFVNFNVKNPETGERLKGKEAIEETMKLTEEAGKFVTRCLKKPHDFEYDKVFYPFIIFSKKRYVGNKYEENPDYYKQTSMGIATKRRDYAPIVKNVYGGAIKILLNERNIVKACNFVKKTCNDLVDGKISNHQLTLTKSLKSEYKSKTPPAHKMLADRIALRDPGNAPSSGQRMEFMYILPPIGQVASKLQADRIETPLFIKEHKLSIDYKYYIDHQIYNPITQLFGLFVDQMPGGVKDVKQMEMAEREYLAGQLLFKEVYDKCEKVNVRNFAKKFGFEVKQKETVIKKTKEVILEPLKKQSILNFQKMNQYIIQGQKEQQKEQQKKKNNSVVLEI